MDVEMTIILKFSFEKQDVGSRPNSAGPVDGFVYMTRISRYNKSGKCIDKLRNY